jgi:predicted GNAT family N-acyltransferase
MSKNLKVIIANSNEQLNQIFNIRKVVFVEEQKVDEREEYDEYESSSKHLIAVSDNIPVGTCRFRNTDKGIKLERFAVLKEYRGNNVGAALVNHSLNLLEGEKNIYLHAQIQVVDFYRKFGFVTVGDEFVEANIRHFKMIYNPT